MQCIIMEKHSNQIKTATFDGTVAWMDYKAHFDACSELNGWRDEQKVLYLSEGTGTGSFWQLRFWQA